MFMYYDQYGSTGIAGAAGVAFLFASSLPGAKASKCGIATENTSARGASSRNGGKHARITTLGTRMLLSSPSDILFARIQVVALSPICFQEYSENNAKNLRRFYPPFTLPREPTVPFHPPLPLPYLSLTSPLPLPCPYLGES